MKSCGRSDFMKTLWIRVEQAASGDYEIKLVPADPTESPVVVPKDWVRPEPYPPVAYRKDCDWSKGGTIDLQ